MFRPDWARKHAEKAETRARRGEAEQLPRKDVITGPWILFGSIDQLKSAALNDERLISTSGWRTVRENLRSDETELESASPVASRNGLNRL